MAAAVAVSPSGATGSLAGTARDSTARESAAAAAAQAPGLTGIGALSAASRLHANDGDARPLSQERVTTGRATGESSAVAANGDSCCLKACFEKVWAAVKEFFKMIVDFFMNLCCPKTGAQLLKQNELLVDLIRPATDGEVNENAVRDVFRGLPKSEQERIAKAAADLCCKQEPVESGEKAVQWLFSGPVELNVVLRRLLENAEMPSAPPAGTRAGDLASGSTASARAAAADSHAEARGLLMGNVALVALLTPGRDQAPTKEELIRELRTMPVANQETIAHAASQTKYPSLFSDPDAIPRTPQDSLAHLCRCSSMVIIAELRSLLASGQPADSKRG